MGPSDSFSAPVPATPPAVCPPPCGPRRQSHGPGPVATLIKLVINASSESSAQQTDILDEQSHLSKPEDVTNEEYASFYKSLPNDLVESKNKRNVIKLYVRRGSFIMDGCDGLRAVQQRSAVQRHHAVQRRPRQAVRTLTVGRQPYGDAKVGPPQGPHLP